MFVLVILSDFDHSRLHAFLIRKSVIFLVLDFLKIFGKF